MRRRMTMLTARIAVLVWVEECASAALGKEMEIATGKPVQAGQSFPSPGGAYLATFTGEGFDIKARATGRLAKVQTLPPVFHAAWTQDEKMLATIAHLAGGTDAACFHFNATTETWNRFEVAPPGGPFQRYEVMKWDVGETRVRVTYY